MRSALEVAAEATPPASHASTFTFCAPRVLFLGEAAASAQFIL